MSFVLFFVYCSTVQLGNIFGFSIIIRNTHAHTHTHTHTYTHRGIYIYIYIYLYIHVYIRLSKIAYTTVYTFVFSGRIIISLNYTLILLHQFQLSSHIGLKIYLFLEFPKLIYFIMCPKSQSSLRIYCLLYYHKEVIFISNLKCDVGFLFFVFCTAFFKKYSIYQGFVKLYAICSFSSRCNQRY